MIVPKSKKFAAKATIATFTPPLQCDLQLSAAKHNSITHAAAATRNLDAAIPLRSADTELQNTKDYERRLHKLQRSAAPKPDLDATAEKRRFMDDFEALFEGISKGKSSLPKSNNSAAKTC